MGLATVALVLAAGLAACLVCGPPAAEAGPLLSEERGLSAPMSEGSVGGGQLTDSNAGAPGPESGEKRRAGRKNRKRAGKGKKGGAGKRGKCKTPECKRERREKRKLRRNKKQERRRNKKNGGGGGGTGKKNRGGKNKRRGEAGEDASAPDAADRRMA